MKKLILDTNVLVSSLIQSNYLYLIVKNCVEGNAVICLSNQVLKEYIEVLGRPKFAKFNDFMISADTLIAQINDIAEFYEPKTTLRIIRDEADNRFLELAESSHADFIITGNTNDFTMQVYKETLIVTPKEYWENYK